MVPQCSGLKAASSTLPELVSFQQLWRFMMQKSLRFIPNSHIIPHGCNTNDAPISYKSNTRHGEQEPWLRGPFNDYSDSESPRRVRKSLPMSHEKENFSPPEATAPPLDDDEFIAFGKIRTKTRDALIQVEGIPKHAVGRMYMLVDFSKWGTPGYRQMLKQRNETMLKMKRKVKKVSFCEVNEVFTLPPIFRDEDTRTPSMGEYESFEMAWVRLQRNAMSQKAIGGSGNEGPKQAFGFRKKPALYIVEEKNMA